MKWTFWIALLAFFLLPSVAVPQEDSFRSSVISLMGADVFRSCGFNKLTDMELEKTLRWALRLGGLGSGHDYYSGRLDEVKEVDGTKYAVMLDGSIWEISWIDNIRAFKFEIALGWTSVVVVNGRMFLERDGHDFDDRYVAGDKYFDEFDGVGVTRIR